MSDKLTADTITDEQIRELRAWALSHCRDHDHPDDYAEYVVGTNAMIHCDIALGFRRARRGGSRSKSRARCAEILNAHRGQP